MFFYVNSIEQGRNTDEQGNVKLYEYSGSKQYSTEKTAISAFYDKLAAVNKDLSDNLGHTFMDIKVVNSLGGVIKKDQIGEYVEE